MLLDTTGTYRQVVVHISYTCNSDYNADNHKHTYPTELRLKLDMGIDVELDQRASESKPAGQHEIISSSFYRAPEHQQIQNGHDTFEEDDVQHNNTAASPLEVS